MSIVYMVVGVFAVIMGFCFYIVWRDDRQFSRLKSEQDEASDREQRKLDDLKGHITGAPWNKGNIKSGRKRRRRRKRKKK